MDQSPLLALGDGLELAHVESTAATLTASIRSTLPSSTCPVCHHPSQRLHSRYQRVVADLPCAGRQVTLHLSVRRFFCPNPACPRKIFAERLAPFVPAWARMTTRLNQALQSIGLATCGELGARLAARLSLPTSPTTLLRRIMALPTPPVARVSELGVDDFSFRRRRRFGTILVDLEQHHVIDLLPERSAESAAAWMRQHPEINFVSRDRGNDYATGTREGAPQAVQIADRFHLIHNLVEAIDPLVARCCKELHQTQAPLPPEVLPTAEAWRPAADPHAERTRLARLAHNQERFVQVMELQRRGVSHREIAQRLSISTRTVQRWITQGACPDHQRRRKRRSIFDPYAPHVLRRWQEGCRDIELLWQEIRDQGFPGAIQTVYRFIRALRQGTVTLPAPSALDRVTAQDALWLIVRRPDALDAEERTNLKKLCHTSPTLATLYTLVQSFGQMVRQREGTRLDAWIQAVTESGLRELERFARGLERDKEAVVAGLTLPLSNAQTEGFVNKLKSIKRLMFGRAGFPLLRQRVLHAV